MVGKNTQSGKLKLAVPCHHAKHVCNTKSLSHQFSLLQSAYWSVSLSDSYRAPLYLSAVMIPQMTYTRKQEFRMNATEPKSQGYWNMGAMLDLPYFRHMSETFRLKWRYIQPPSRFQDISS